MKNIKFLMLFLSILVSVFISCSSGDETTIETQKSSALRIYLNEFKGANNISGRSTSTDSNFCYEFVYPLTLAYNNGTVVNVSNEAELIAILESETNELFINGIAFPFNLIAPGSTTPITISNESEFWSVVNACDMNTYDNYIASGSCYSFVYPFSLLMSNNQTVTLNNDQDLLNLVAQQGNSDNYVVNLVYPFSVNSNNTITQIDNEYEFAQLNNDCDDNNCNCTTEVNPVCVNVGGVIISFTNACVAECAGYTSADFVTCN
jgi:hypothetical protein